MLVVVTVGGGRKGGGAVVGDAGDAVWTLLVLVLGGNCLLERRSGVWRIEGIHVLAHVWLGADGSTGADFLHSLPPSPRCSGAMD